MERIDDNIVDIGDFLAKEITEPFIYVANSGNAGDALMACATYDVFNKLALDYTNVDHEALANLKNFENKIIVLSGGGNFNESGYNPYAKLLRQIHGYAKKVIILPHTINGNDKLLSTLGSNVTLICRERVSYDHVRKTAGFARVYLSHDMAFNLDVVSLLNNKPRYMTSILKKLGTWVIDRAASRQYPTLHDYKQGIYQAIVRRASGERVKKIAYLYRMDIESTDVSLPSGNVDASLVFNYGVSSPCKAHYTVHHLLKFLDGFEVIHTNRLHIAIASALLDKKVQFHANNYYKCRAVYEHSIKERFPNVIWHG